MVKNKSEKGKIIADVLKKNNIKTEGFLYTLLYKGGNGNEEQLSHPISYLVNMEQNKNKFSLQNGKLVISDELKNKKVPNIIPIIDKIEKEGIQEHGKIWSSAVEKMNYKFDLSQETPILILSDAKIFNIETGQWIPSQKENQQIPIDGDYDNFANELIGSLANVEIITTYQNFVDEVNKRQDILNILNKHHS